ncbi:restriction endonuclease subunit S, partial [Clostridium perfringens]
MRYKSYKNYKSSNVNYLPEFPSEWNIMNMKYLISNIQTGSTPSTKNQDYFNGNIQWFTPGDFKEQFLIEANKKITETAIRDNEAKLLGSGTVCIVGIGATLGKVAILKEESSFNQQITGINTNEKLNNRYLYYWLLDNNERINKIANYTTLPIINNEFLKNLKVLVPAIEEQEKIVEFLDKKSSEIDDLIEEKRKLIKLLKEKREAIITESVTKGVDKNVKMKNSGVEWIGKIPWDWQISKIKYITNINQNTLSENQNKDFRFKYVDIGSVNSFGEFGCLEEMSFEKAPSRARRKIKDGDTIISTVRTYLKAISSFKNIENENIICSTGFAVLTPTNKINSEYLALWVRNQKFINEIVRRSKGVSYPAITAKEIGDIEIIL